MRRWVRGTGAVPFRFGSFWIFLRLWLFVGGAAEAATAVWIDTDPAIGAPWREVDDAFALVLAFHSPEIEIAGLSNTYGNASLPRTDKVTRELVRRFGGAAGVTESEVHAGAGAPGETSSTEASEALARALRKQKLTYLALGPLTNLTAFLKLHPELAARIERVIFVGGQSTPGRVGFGRNGSQRVHDANVFKDPAAVAALLRSAIPVVLTPIELAPPLALTRADLETLRKSGGAGEYLFRETRVWLWFWTGFAGERGGLPFDVLGILPALRPVSLLTEERFVSLNAAGELVARKKAGRGARRVRFGTGVSGGAKELVVERLRRRP
ncbi:MAG: nucleoside hydrolase [Chthoniobacterales bacterium]